jgi:hypothetical protein
MQQLLQFMLFPVFVLTWQCVKTLHRFCSHQNSLDLWMFIPFHSPKNGIKIGIDPYPLNLIYWAGPLHANIDRSLVVLVVLVALVGVPCADRPRPAKESSES